MQYTINWVEHKEYNGQKFLAARVKPLDGPEFDATLWGDKWGERLAQITPGMQLEANPWQNPKNQKWSLYPPQEKKAGGGSGASRTASITQAQERKTESINKSMDRKEEAIKLASAQRDAVLIVTTFYKEMEVENYDKYIQDEITKWRNWFLLDEEFNNPPPFN